MNFLKSHLRCCCVGLMAMVAPAFAGESTPPTPTPPPSSSVTEIDAVRPSARQSLLREGSRLIQTQGVISHQEDVGSWQLIIEPSDESMPRYVLTLLPSTHLTDAQRVIESVTDDRPLVFEVGGEVMVFQSQNYLLLTHPPRVVAQSEGEYTDDPETTDGPDRRSRDAASIMRDMERQTGPIQRRPGRATNAEDEERSTREHEHLQPEGTSIVMRRGKVSRDSRGAWKFIFDSDATGLDDPPMTLLPCMTLQRLVRHEQVRGQAPILLSGRIMVYEGRNYLLPTVFQTPRERSGLTP